MKQHIIKIQNFLFLFFFPFIAGCLSSGGSGNSFDALAGDGLFFASGSSGGGTSNAIGGSMTVVNSLTNFSYGSAGGEQTLAQITNPEPASLFLLGGGLWLMKYLKNKA